MRNVGCVWRMITMLSVSLCFVWTFFDARPAFSQNENTPALLDRLIKNIYALRTPPELARSALSALHDRLRNAENTDRRNEGAADRALIFPVAGYSARDVGGARGNSYVESRSYDFFDGNAHRGHPALDIFIHDRNQDCLSDRTGKPVDVRSVCDGIVVCVHAAWTSDSVDARGKILRSGKCVYIYSREEDALWYYAHLQSVFVTVGESVGKAKVIGTVGRSGANAMKKRSDTHLHLMYLKWMGEKLQPENPFKRLGRE